LSHELAALLTSLLLDLTKTAVGMGIVSRFWPVDHLLCDLNTCLSALGTRHLTCHSCSSKLIAFNQAYHIFAQTPFHSLIIHAAFPHTFE
jgi:hypothetical protein